MISTIKIETDLITLMEVLEKTGNATVAAQILDGTYKEPEFLDGDKVSSKDKDGNCERLSFIRYDKWKDEVHYKHPNSWTREMSQLAWHKLTSWEDYERKVMAEAILEDADFWDGDDSVCH
jgi:hypothetical protein